MEIFNDIFLKSNDDESRISSGGYGLIEVECKLLKRDSYLVVTYLNMLEVLKFVDKSRTVFLTVLYIRTNNYTSNYSIQYPHKPKEQTKQQTKKRTTYFNMIKENKE